MESTLERIKVFVDKAHGSQMRKYSPERYIVHPLRVMQTCKRYTNELPILAAALLHDVLEDTPINKEALLSFLSGIMNQTEAIHTLTLVEELTDIYVKDSYPQLNRRIRKQKEL